jgi:hypothetical protein
MNDIYRTIEKTLNFTVRDKETGDPIDITTATDIRACLQTIVEDVGGGGVVIVSGPRGKFTVTFGTADTGGFTLGKDTVEGQIEFGTTNDPIPFTAEVTIKDKPC